MRECREALFNFLPHNPLATTADFFCLVNGEIDGDKTGVQYQLLIILVSLNPISNTTPTAASRRLKTRI